MRASFLLLPIALLFTIPPQAAAWQQNSNSVAAADKAQTAAPTSNNSSDDKPREKVKAGTSPATGQISTPGAAAAPQKPASTGGKSPAAVSSAMPYPENERLREQVQSTLRSEPSLAGSRLEVNVNDSQIELSGSVATAREKETARRIAQSYGNNRRVVDSKVNVQSGGTQSSRGER